MTPGRQRSSMPLAASRRTAESRRSTLASSHRTFRARVHAFTVIEMMIVVGIIVLLAALTLTVVTTLTAKAETSQVENTFKLLEMSLQNWEEASSRQVTLGDPSTPLPNGQTPRYDFDATQYAANDPVQQELLTSRVLGLISTNPSAQEALAKIDPDLIQRVDEVAPATGTRIRLIDPWDKSIRVVFPGRKYMQNLEAGSVVRDEDGTIRIASEDIHGICVSGRMAFVSAGPDGDFGDLDLGASTPAPTPATLDNIYSNTMKTR